MRLVLDNVEDGFLTVDRAGVRSDGRSGIVERWFGAPQPGSAVFDYLDSVAPLASSRLRLG